MSYDLPKQRKWRTYPMANEAYGFPRGKKRGFKPFLLHCMHITGNKNTASMPAGLGPGTGTGAEASWLARPRSPSNPGNSAHSYIARDGAIMHFYPTSYAGWNNGPLLRPNMKLDSVKKIVNLHDTKGVNPNEVFVRETESTGYSGSHPLTKSQRESLAYLIAADSIEWDIPINRETVLVHADLDSVNRSSCPFPASVREKQLGDIIERARVIKQLLKNPAPDPEPEPEPVDPCADVEAQLESANGLLEAANDDLAALGALVASMAEILDGK